MRRAGMMERDAYIAWSFRWSSGPSAGTAVTAAVAANGRAQADGEVSGFVPLAFGRFLVKGSAAGLAAVRVIATGRTF